MDLQRQRMSKRITSADASQWSSEEKKQLLHAVVEMGCSPNMKSHKAAESSLKWENVKVDGRSAEECKATYHKLTSKVRKYRTLQEVIADALVLVDEPGKLSDEYPDMPKKPPTAFSLFIMKRSKKFPDIKGTKKMTVFANDWNEISEEKKESYRKKYLKLKKKYEEELEVFRQNHPECPLPAVNSTGRPNPPLPSRLFIDSRIGKMKIKHPEMSNAEAMKILTNKYKELPPKKKLKWIKRAMDRRQTYQDTVDEYLAHKPKSTTKPALLHLSKEEERIWNISKGKPVPAPPKNVFQFFCNIKRKTMQHLNIFEQSRELSASYHKLTEEEVKDLTKLFEKEVEEYVQAYTHYYDSLPEEEKAYEKAPNLALAAYNKILQKKKKKLQSKKAEVDGANDKKAKLSDLLPRPNYESDSDIDGSLSSSGMVVSTKRKSAPLVPVTPQRKSKHVPVLPAQNDILDDDALLSMFTPKQDNDALSPAEDVNDTHKKKSKKAKKSKEVEKYVQAYTDYYDSLPKEEKADEKAQKEALAAYNKILQEDQKQKSKKSKSKKAEVDGANNKKVKLSDLLPRPNYESDSDSDGSLPSSGIVASTKRKGAPLDPVTPHKKSKHVPVLPAQNDILDDDALLSMFTPKQDNDALSPAEDFVDTPRKKSKKAKKSKA